MMFELIWESIHHGTKFAVSDYDAEYESCGPTTLCVVIEKIENFPLMLVRMGENPTIYCAELNVVDGQSFIDLQMREDVESNTGLNLEFSDDFPDSSFIVLD